MNEEEIKIAIKYLRLTKLAMNREKGEEEAKTAIQTAIKQLGKALPISKEGGYACPLCSEKLLKAKQAYCHECGQKIKG